MAFCGVHEEDLAGDDDDSDDEGQMSLGGSSGQTRKTAHRSRSHLATTNDWP